MSVNRDLRTITAIAALVLILPHVSTAESISLNVKDSTGTDKFVVYDTGNVKTSGSIYKGNNAPISGVVPDINIVREDGTPRITVRDTMTNAGGGGILNLMHNNGTDAARNPPLNGDVLGRVTFGSINSLNNITNAAMIFGIATENYTDTTFGGKLIFRTVPNGTNGYVERMVIDSTGNVGIATSTPAYTLDVNGYGRFTYGIVSGSDIKLKKNLLPISDALGKVLQMGGVSYEWKDDYYTVKNEEDGSEVTKKRDIPAGRHYGVIAQEIEKVLPEVVTTGADGTKAVAYTEIIAFLIEAIKAQQKQIDELKQKVR
jgi:hypothetical protein